MIRRCASADLQAMYALINRAAQGYRGVIPEDRWREPYMPAEELRHEIAAGVAFWGWEGEGELLGVMGLQEVGDVALIRHAYVRPERQRQGIGGELLDHLRAQTARPLLVGTWAAATWAIRFYERHGFRRVPPDQVALLLRTYWTIPERQVETSVVLADGRWFDLNGAP